MGMTTTPPSASRTKAMPPTVKQSETAFSFTKPRFSLSPLMMFSVSNSAFIAALALHSDTASPITNVRPSVCDPSMRLG
jgi:hypothetical protein